MQYETTFWNLLESLQLLFLTIKCVKKTCRYLVSNIHYWWQSIETTIALYKGIRKLDMDILYKWWVSWEITGRQKLTTQVNKRYSLNHQEIFPSFAIQKCHTCCQQKAWSFLSPWKQHSREMIIGSHPIFHRQEYANGYILHLKWQERK